MKHNVDEAAAYGITVYDWRHARLEWVNNHPNGMNDDELLLDREQSGCDPGIEGEQPRVWLYRNKIKALDWIGQVRETLDDPAYADRLVTHSCQAKPSCPTVEGGGSSYNK